MRLEADVVWFPTKRRKIWDAMDVIEEEKLSRENWENLGNDLRYKKGLK